MPEMISILNVRVASTSGDVLLFEARKPVNVPAHMVALCASKGCALLTPELADIVDNTSRQPVDFVGDIRASLLFLASKSVAERNKASDFDSSGTPKAAIVSKLVGFDAGQPEVRKIFEKYLDMTKNGTAFNVHPTAVNAMRVIEAEDRAELADLGVELLGADKAELEGMQTKDLRAFLLKKLQG